MISKQCYLGCLLLGLGLPITAGAQSVYAPQGTEYPIAGTPIGDQAHSDIAIKNSGGLLVWEDNFIDGDGLGISALRLDGNLSASFSSFRVNQQGAMDQQNPRVTLLNSGGSVIVWQGGRQSFQNIYARFMANDGTWLTGDVLVNSYTNPAASRMNPSVTTLTNGDVVVVWASYGQANVVNAMQDVYGQRFSPTGQKLGGEFAINQTLLYNQRNPSISALNDGKFVVVWASEPAAISNNVVVVGRIFDSNATPVTGEFVVNDTANMTSSPAVAGSPNSGFLVTWSEKVINLASNGWDIFARPFSGSYVGGITHLVNTNRYGDQHSSRVCSQGADYFVVWTSMGQDGSREGVYARYLAADGSSTLPEFRVNTSVVNQQIQPSVASDRSGRFIVTWSTFTGLSSGMDLAAQRYALVSLPLPAPSAPLINVIATNILALTWPPVGGFPVQNYEIYADDAVSATASTTNTYWSATGLAAGSTHSFRLAYVLGDGRRSILSSPATGTTYAAGATWGGIPQEWMTRYFGGDLFQWPSPTADSDGDGASNLQEFKAGTDPNDANSVLRTRLQHASQGLYLNWNTQPGLVYQVIGSSDMTTWSNIGGPRFAAGFLDSIYLGPGPGKIGYYQVLRLR